MDFNKIKHVKDMIYSLYHDAKKAHDYLFDDDQISGDNQEIIAGILLNKANCTFASLHSFYYCNHEYLCDDLIDDILSSFSIFSKEFLNNLSTNHSHQWTNIEFTRFEEFVKELM